MKTTKKEKAPAAKKTAPKKTEKRPASKRMPDMKKTVSENKQRTDKEIDTRESRLTRDDLEALGPRDMSMDGGDDERELMHREYPVDFSGSDLDIPGSELDDDEEAIGEEDEENNSYSSSDTN